MFISIMLPIHYTVYMKRKYGVYPYRPYGAPHKNKRMNWLRFSLLFQANLMLHSLEAMKVQAYKEGKSIV